MSLSKTHLIVLKSRLERLRRLCAAVADAQREVEESRAYFRTVNSRVVGRSSSALHGYNLALDDLNFAQEQLKRALAARDRLALTIAQEPLAKARRQIDQRTWKDVVEPATWHVRECLVQSIEDGIDDRAIIAELEEQLKSIRWAARVALFQRALRFLFRFILPSILR